MQARTKEWIDEMRRYCSTTRSRVGSIQDRECRRRRLRNTVNPQSRVVIRRSLFRELADDVDCPAIDFFLPFYCRNAPVSTVWIVDGTALHNLFRTISKIIVDWNGNAGNDDLEHGRIFSVIVEIEISIERSIQSSYLARRHVFIDFLARQEIFRGDFYLLGCRMVRRLETAERVVVPPRVSKKTVTL